MPAFSKSSGETVPGVSMSLASRSRHAWHEFLIRIGRPIVGVRLIGLGEAIPFQSFCRPPGGGLLSCHDEALHCAPFEAGKKFRQKIWLPQIKSDFYW